MSYEVFIDVRHHPRHLDDAERKESTCFKFSDLPEGTNELIYVVNGLREFAARIDPRVRCTHCGEIRDKHFREGKHLYRCFNRGPITQAAWWEKTG